MNHAAAWARISWWKFHVAFSTTFKPYTKIETKHMIAANSFLKKNASLLVSVRCFQNKNLGFRIHSQIKRQSFRRNDCNTFVTRFIFFAVTIYSRNSTSANSVLANKKWCGIGETLFESSKSLSKISKHLVSLRGSLKVNKHLFQFTISCFCLYHLTWYKVSRRIF